MMLEGEEGEHSAAAAEGPAHPWRAAEVTADARHAPHCVGNGSGPCADTYIDMPHNWYGDKESDVALDVNDITPFMYKNTKGGYMLRQHRLAAQVGFVCVGFEGIGRGGLGRGEGRVVTTLPVCVCVCPPSMVCVY